MKAIERMLIESCKEVDKLTQAIEIERDHRKTTLSFIEEALRYLKSEDFADRLENIEAAVNELERAEAMLR